MVQKQRSDTGKVDLLPINIRARVAVDSRILSGIEDRGYSRSPIVDLSALKAGKGSARDTRKRSAIARQTGIWTRSAPVA